MADNSPGYHYTWLQNVTGPVEHALNGAEQAEAGYYEMLEQSLDVKADPDMHTEAVMLAHSWLVCGLVILLAFLARQGLNRARALGGVQQYVPDATFTARNFFELFPGSLYDVVASIMGKEDARKFFPLSGALFLYILFGNTMGLVPGFTSPTGSFQTNLAMSLVVLVVFVVAGVQRNGANYFKHMMGPVLPLAVIILPVELISNFLARPFSLTLRLTGNMFGDHLVFGIMSDLTHLVIPCLFLALGAFVSVIQALVFSLLSTVYIALSVAPMDDHH